MKIGAGPARTGTRGLVVALATTLAATAVLVVTRADIDPTLALGLVVAAFAGWAILVRGVDEAGRSMRRAVVIGVGALLLLAVVVPPQGSDDAWGYAMFGREVSAHGVSPYDHVPAAFPHDPMLARMGSGYTRTRSPYGPVFTAYSAAGTAVTGASPLATRLVFQGGAALAILAALALLWRRTRSVGALVWVGLNPLIVVSVVNDGHNDAFVALGILAGVLLATDRRRFAAGVVLGLAGLVKLPALLGAGGVTLWAWRRHGPRAAALIGGTAAAVTVLGYAAVGPPAIAAIGDSAGVLSRASAWSPVRDWLVASGRQDAVAALPALAVLAVIGLAVLLALGRARDRDAAASAGGAAAAFTFAGGYVLPWYAAWGLPSLALRRTTPIAWLAALEGAFLLAVYQLPDHAAAVDNGLLVHRVLTDVVPVTILATAVALGVASLAARRQAGRSSLSSMALSRRIS